MELSELQIRMAKAIADNDVQAIEAIAAEIVKGKGDRHKAEALAAQAEATALAGDREALAKELYTAVKGLPEVKKLLGVKVKSFTFTVSHREAESPAGQIDPKGAVQVQGGVVLVVPTIKVPRAGKGGGGAVGKSKDEYGISLGDIFEKYADIKDKAALAEATGNNSKQWQIKVKVKKCAIASGLLAPVK